jgi:hypothetical protein
LSNVPGVDPWVCAVPAICSMASTVRCGAGSYGYVCTGSAQPYQGWNLTCGDGVRDPDGTSTDFCCATSGAGTVDGGPCVASIGMSDADAEAGCTSVVEGGDVLECGLPPSSPNCD